MGIISGLLGNAVELKGARLDDLLEAVIIPGEQVEKAYQLIRDIFVFTNKRLILIDKQGVTGKKIEFLSIPYSKITKFAQESAGHFDLDSELKIWVGSDPTPITKEFRKNVNISEVYAVLSRYVLD
ncbi:MAG: PH domain-containing protein [Leptolyngbya sp. SIO1E4]|nr:PH domain-containing protein [Leptolyngbya sp. SIO1E4]